MTSGPKDLGTPFPPNVLTAPIDATHFGASRATVGQALQPCPRPPVRG
jgi:hypothetical protein